MTMGLAKLFKAKKIEEKGREPDDFLPPLPTCAIGAVITQKVIKKLTEILAHANPSACFDLFLSEGSTRRISDVPTQIIGVLLKHDADCVSVYDANSEDYMVQEYCFTCAGDAFKNDDSQGRYRWQIISKKIDEASNIIETQQLLYFLHFELITTFFFVLML
jgi:hypothetical protein